ncbi:type II toxin-antitoxin system HipA family toxin [soil metagenome]
MAVTERLIVWLHDRPVATIDRRRGGDARLTYTTEAIERFQINTPLLSCSLPITSRPHDATTFVDGLLPEGEHRRLLADRARIAAHDTYGLIARYGRDIAGAVQFRPDGDNAAGSSRWAVEQLDSDRIDGLVAELPANPLAIDDESELSLAGLQNKMLLVRMPDGSWGRPLHGRPSTHILKRDSERHRGIVAAESDALSVARHIGLTPVQAWVEAHGGYDCLIVERFDRVVDGDGNVVARVHQEDACQALGIAPTRKYEVHHGGGGPAFEQIAQVLDRYAAVPTAELDRLAALAAFNAIVGNADAHGKNVGFLLDGDGTIRLAPVYDVVPTVLWPALRRDMAMSLGGAVSPGAMNLAALAREAKRWRHSESSATAAAARCAQAMIAAVEDGVVDTDGPLAHRIRQAARAFVP